MTVSDGDDGRDPRGRFAKGNRAGRGNPHYNAVKKYKDGIRQAFGVKAVVEVLRKLKRRCSRTMPAIFWPPCTATNPLAGMTN